MREEIGNATSDDDATADDDAAETAVEKRQPVHGEQDVPHHDDVGCGQWGFKKIAAHKAHAVRSAVCINIIIKYGTDFHQVETDAREMRIGKRDLHGQIALCGADVDKGFVLLPGELIGNGQVGAVTHARHGA